MFPSTLTRTDSTTSPLTEFKTNFFSDGGRLFSVKLTQNVNEIYALAPYDSKSSLRGRAAIASLGSLLEMQYLRHT